MNSPETTLAFAMEIVERQEAALFKIACGMIEAKVLTRVNMMDLAEEALPAHLAEFLKKSKQTRGVSAGHPDRL